MKRRIKAVSPLGQAVIADARDGGDEYQSLTYLADQLKGYLKQHKEFDELLDNSLNRLQDKTFERVAPDYDNILTHITALEAGIQALQLKLTTANDEWYKDWESDPYERGMLR